MREAPASRATVWGIQADCAVVAVQTAMELAKRLEAHPMIARVHYPGLPSHRDHRIAKVQMPGGFGGVISFEASLQPAHHTMHAPCTSQLCPARTNK